MAEKPSIKMSVKNNSSKAFVVTKKTVNVKISDSSKPIRTSAMKVSKSESGTMANMTQGRSVKVHKLTVLIALVIIILGVILFYGRGLVVAAVVNGQPISRLSLVQEVEKASGKQALASLIRNVLIEQEARKQNVIVGYRDIDNQIKTIETNLSKQGQKLDQMLLMQGMTRDDLRKIVTLDLLVTKLVEKDIKVTEKEVNDYIEKNKDLLPKDKTENELKKMAREQLKKQLLSQKAQAWIAGLEKKANIVKFVDY